VAHHLPDRVELVSQDVEGDAEGDFSFAPSSAVLLLPLGADDGTTWSFAMTSRSGDTTVQADSRVVRRETLTVGGEQVRATVVESTLDIDNPELDATQTRTTWVAEDLGLTLREESTTTGTATVNGAPVDFTTTTSRLLRSTRPA
jgi:hypothetical protein